MSKYKIFLGSTLVIIGMSIICGMIQNRPVNHEGKVYTTATVSKHADFNVLKLEQVEVGSTYSEFEEEVEEEDSAELIKVDSSRNPFDLPWYTSYTMPEHESKSLDVASVMGSSYASGGSATITHMDVCVSTPDVNYYSILFADKTHAGDVSYKVNGFNSDYHKSITVTNEAGKSAKLATADNRILIAVPPRVRALFTGEQYTTPGANKKYNSCAYARGVYVDVVFEDGTVLACIQGDAKSGSDGWYCGDLMHNRPTGGCIEFLTDDGVANGPVSSFSEFFGNQRVKELRVYTDIQAVNSENEIVYYFSEGL